MINKCFHRTDGRCQAANHHWKNDQNKLCKCLDSGCYVHCTHFICILTHRCSANSVYLYIWQSEWLNDLFVCFDVVTTIYIASSVCWLWNNEHEFYHFSASTNKSVRMMIIINSKVWSPSRMQLWMLAPIKRPEILFICLLWWKKSTKPAYTTRSNKKTAKFLLEKISLSVWLLSHKWSNDTYAMNISRMTHVFFFTNSM